MKILRTLGLAALMTLALGASVGAASASAETQVGVYVTPESSSPMFEAEKYPANLYGSATSYTQFNFFNTLGLDQEGKCTKTELFSKISNPEKYLGTRMSYSGCTAQNGSQVTVDSSKCPVVYELEKYIGLGLTFAKVHIVCEKSAIEFVQKVFGITICTVQVPEQSLASAALFSNGVGGGKPNERTIKIAAMPLKNVKYTRTGGGCGEAGQGTFTDGTMSINNLTVQGSTP